jgi:hypothetical protein
MARLSLAAELLIVAIDPRRGGLLRRRRRHFRRALAVASGYRRTPLAGWRARRGAHRELRAAGLLAPDSTARRPRLADRKARAEVLRRVRRCVLDSSAGELRDRELLPLMAWSGLLVPWLTRDERRLALRRIQDAEAPVSDVVARLGGLFQFYDLYEDAGFAGYGGGDQAPPPQPGAAGEGSGL